MNIASSSEPRTPDTGVGVESVTSEAPENENQLAYCILMEQPLVL